MADGIFVKSSKKAGILVIKVENNNSFQEIELSPRQAMMVAAEISSQAVKILNQQAASGD